MKNYTEEKSELEKAMELDLTIAENLNILLVELKKEGKRLNPKV